MHKIPVWLRRPVLWTSCIIAATFCLRLVLIAQNWPQTNSDEGTMGIIALHIAYLGQHPLIYYGQSYMGTLQGYVGALLFHLFGPSLFSLRLGLVLMFAVYLFVMYLLTSALYSKGLAVITVFLLAFAPRDLLYHQLLAIGGHAELPLFAALLLLLAAWLALTYQREELPLRVPRLVLYTSWGGIAGLALWDDYLILPFILMSALLLIVVCHRELRPVLVLCTALAFIVGMMPLIAFTILHHSSSSPTSILDLTMTWQGQTNTPLDSLIGTIMVALPIVSGGYTLCPVQPGNEKPLMGLTSPANWTCAIAHTSVGLGFLLLLAFASAQALYTYWQLRRENTGGRQGEGKKAPTTLYLARLMLLGTAVLTLLEYVITPQAAMSPWSTSRYLVALPVTLPALLWPLWSAIRATPTGASRRASVLLIGKYALISCFLLLPLAGTFEAWQAVPQAQEAMSQQTSLIANLHRLGIKHFYTEYWTCDRIAFASQEQLTCAVLGDQLQPGMNRYLPYRDAVRSDPRAAYVFPTSDHAALLALQKKMLFDKQLHRPLYRDEYAIYPSAKSS